MGNVMSGKKVRRQSDGNEDEPFVKNKNNSTYFVNHNIKVFWNSAYDSDKSMKVLPTSELEGVDQKLSEYHSGEITALDVADAIICALFHRDHQNLGDHWDYDGSRCDETFEDEISSTFNCKCSATWDWKDIYSVASSKAHIRILKSKNEIYIEDYSYYCAG
jgi:hypothetical protein